MTKNIVHIFIAFTFFSFAQGSLSSSLPSFVPQVNQVDSGCIVSNTPTLLTEIFTKSLQSVGFATNIVDSSYARISIHNNSGICEISIIAQSGTFSREMKKSVGPVDSTALEQLLHGASKELAQQYENTFLGSLSIICEADSVHLQIEGIAEQHCPIKLDHLPLGKYIILSQAPKRRLWADTVEVRAGEVVNIYIPSRLTQQEKLDVCLDSLGRVSYKHLADSIVMAAAMQQKKDSIAVYQQTLDSLGSQLQTVNGTLSNLLAFDSNLVEVGTITVNDSFSTAIRDTILECLLRGAVQTNHSIRRIPLSGSHRTGKVLSFILTQEKGIAQLEVKIMRPDGGVQSTVAKMDVDDSAWTNRIAQRAARSLFGPNAALEEPLEPSPLWLRLSLSLVFLLTSVITLVNIR